MTIEEIRYRLQAMATMCTFQDAVGHDLSQKEIKLYNQAKDEAIDTMRKYEKIQETYRRFQKDDEYHPFMAWLDVMAVIEDGNE